MPVLPATAVMQTSFPLGLLIQNINTKNNIRIFRKFLCGIVGDIPFFACGYIGNEFIKIFRIAETIEDISIRITVFAISEEIYPWFHIIPVITP